MRSKKSIFWIALSAIMILSLALASCQSAAPDEPAAEPDAPAVADEPADAGGEEEVFTFAVMTVGPFNDNGWSSQHNQVGLDAEAYFGGRVKYIGVENVPYGEEVGQTIELLIAQGADLIVEAVAAPPFADPVIAAHPETKFIVTAGTGLENQANLQWVWFNQGSYQYLLGIAAGLLTETNHIGYVAPFDFPSIRTQYNAYALGAQSVNPDVVTHVVTVNSWFDPAGARQATETLIDAGIDVIGGDMDEPTKVAVAEERGVWAMGAYTNAQKEFGPTTYVNTYIFDFSAQFLPIIEALLDGEWIGNSELIYHEIPDGIDIGEWGDNVPQDVIDKVMAVRQQMIDGFNPFVGPWVDKDGVEVLADGETFTPVEMSIGWNFVLPGIEGVE